MPDFIEPALASAIEKVPSGARWVHEIKFDGYRVQVHLKDAAAKVFTRRGHDWTNRFKKIAIAHDDGQLLAASATRASAFFVDRRYAPGSGFAMGEVARVPPSSR